MGSFISKRDVQEILESIFNLPISLGLISNTAQRVSKQLEDKYIYIQQEISKSSYLHIDETGHKSKGKRGWTWIFTNKEYSLLRLTSSRGKQVLTTTLGNYEGYALVIAMERITNLRQKNGKYVGRI